VTRTHGELHLTTAACETIAAEAAQRLPVETGGILLGYREAANIVVTHALVVEGPGASRSRYVRDDVEANRILEEFLKQRSSDDVIGYVGEWHSHPAPSGPSPTDHAAMREIAKRSSGPVGLVVHIPTPASFVGRIARRQLLGHIQITDAAVVLPPARFKELGPLPAGAVRADGPVFISYRQSDGTEQADALEAVLRAVGLVVWRDRTDLRPGTTTDRLEQVLTHGLSGAVLVVTPDIKDSEIVRERELPRLLQLDQDPAFCLCIANKIPQEKHPSKCDYGAPDGLFRLAPARTLADKKQANLLDPSGEVEVARDLVMHRMGQRSAALRRDGRPVTIRIQTRPAPFAVDAGEDDLHVRVSPPIDGRLPSQGGLQLLRTTLPIISDAVYSTGATTVRITGGAHLSIALALGAALPETKIGRVEVIDTRGAIWSSATPPAAPSTTDLLVEILPAVASSGPSGRDRIAVFVSLTPNSDRTAFDQLVRSPAEPFGAVARLSVAEAEIDPRESGRLSAAIANQIKRLAANSGRAEVHLAFHGPFTMAVLIGRHLNTLRTVVYEWSGPGDAVSSYTPVLTLEPGTAKGPIVEVVTASGSVGW
jgi:integrative and conjugative element protein (TIGR02256 family)